MAGRSVAWPEVDTKRKAIGIERMEIFRSKNHPFMYLTVPDDFDFERDPEKFKGSPRNKEWNDIMSSDMQKVPQVDDGDVWHVTSLAFDSEWSEK